MSERAPYSRVYWTVRFDERLASIYPDNDHLATWLRLLIAADMAWPAPADLPGAVRKASVKALQAEGIIELLPGGLYRFHGLDAERDRRKAAATRGTPTGTQLGGKRDARPSAITGLRRDETRQAEPSRTRAAIDTYTRDGLLHVTPLVAEAWVDACGLTLLGSGAFAMGRVDDACRRHPESKVIAAIQTARDGFDHIPDAAAFVIAMRNVLDPLPSGKEAQRAATENRDAIRSRRAVQATKRQAHETGWHADTPDPMCDACNGRAA